MIPMRTRNMEPTTSPGLRALILIYEVGDLVKDLVYYLRFPAEANAHKANMQLSIADAMIQLELLAHQMGFDPEELHRLGEEHLKERYREFERRGWR